MYIDKKRNVVVIEIFSLSFVPTLEKRLRDAGIAFTTERFFSGFWGERFLIERPRGKGSIAKMNFLDEVCR